MKLNKKLITVCSILTALTSLVQAERQYAQKHDENVVAATVEMPGNLVGSLFGGGYANRERIDNEDRDEKEIRPNKRNKKSKKDDQQPANRRMARRQRRRSSSSEE